ncbi:hypothetical protein AMECASPLE_010689 [Ameca splendens]|uniref:C2H2-type domain-containing protein n=1 Tax=Ameca splendens TaxID=208324 RepID=A0ABV0XPQ8_9TELE
MDIWTFCAKNSGSCKEFWEFRLHDVQVLSLCRPDILQKMSNKLCGICYGNYINLTQHLRCFHAVKNPMEHELLLKFGNGR